MSMDYAIKIKLDAECNEDSIAKIFERGSQKGFIYHDHIWGEKYRDAPILDVRRAVQKIMKAFVDKPDDGPCVYTVIPNNPDENVMLWFFETDNGFLEFHMGAFGSPRKKGYFIDFDYYIRLCLDLVKDFHIMEVKTAMYD